MPKNIIAIEGIDGSGKTTQAKLLQQRLIKENINCILTREPSSGQIGLFIRKVLSGECDVDERAMALLFAADRLDHLFNSRSDINQGSLGNNLLIIDRYYLSSFAYQSSALGEEFIIAANTVAIKFFKPLCHIFMDINLDTAMERISARGQKTDVYENRAYLEKVRKSYFETFERFSGKENIIIVDANREVSQISAEIWGRIRDFLKGRFDL